MKVPEFSRTKYVGNTVFVVLLFAAFQYFGVFSSSAGGIEPVSLVVIGVTFPAFRFALELLFENVSVGVTNE